MGSPHLSTDAIIWRCLGTTIAFATAVRVTRGPSLSALELATGVAALTLSFLLLFATLHARGKRGKEPDPPVAVAAAVLSRFLGLRTPLWRTPESEKMSGQSNCHGESPKPDTDA
jgi:hypothetical protein